MRFFLLLSFIFFSGFFKSQQNEDFFYVKKYYDEQRLMISDAFKTKYEKEENLQKKGEIIVNYREFMHKLDSVQNKAYLAALIKVKNKEDLHLLPILEIEKIDLKQNKTEKEILEILPEYPGGINNLRTQFEKIFYADFLLNKNESLSSEVTFVVEKDGSISTVKSTGDNFSFNRQAEIATYLLPYKFSPAKKNGELVRYRFRFPISYTY